MRNHTTPKIFELNSTGGKNPSLTPGAQAQTATFLMQNVPVGKDGKFWYYALALVIKLVVTFDQAAMGGSVVNADKLWKVLQSVQVQCPLLGQLFLHGNTRGAVLGNIIQYLGYGYNALPVRPQIAAADGDTTVTLYYRVPFAYEFLRKPHETAPWGGFLENGTVEVKLDVSTVFDGDSTGAVIKAPTNLRAWLEMIPSPEPVIHTPVHWREHLTPGGGTKHTILDMGSADGLQGIDTSKGVGIAALLNLGNPTGLGLGGSGAVNNILSFDIPWRDQDRVDVPEATLVAMAAHMGNQRRAKPAAPVTTDSAGFPNDIAQANSTGNNDPVFNADGMFLPLIVPGRDLETSKLQSQAGAREMNFTYTATPAGQSRFLGMYFPVFDEQYMLSLAARIHPTGSGELVAKTLNKQAGMIHGQGKAAYVRAKVL
jgi:hypothetical protein